MSGGAPLRLLGREIAVALAIAAVLTIFANIGLLFVPIYDMILYDRVLMSKNLDTVTMLTIGVACGMVLYAALEFCRSATFIVVADRLNRRLALPAIAGALQRALAGDGAAAAQATRDVNELRLFVSGPAATIPFELLWAPGVVTILFLLHPLYGTYALGCGTILFAVSLAADLLTKKELQRQNAAQAKTLNDLAATLRQAELLEGMGMLPDLARRWSREQHRQMTAMRGTLRLARMLSALAKALRLLMQAGIITLGVVLVMRSEASPGSMMGANLLAARVLVPFEQLVTGWRQWSAALAAWSRLRKLLAGAGRAAEGEVPARLEGRLEFRDAGFEAAGRAVLADVSFVVEPGEAVALVGPSGAGKSTLARLATGVLAPTSGAVLVDGLEVTRWDRMRLGRHMGYLPQSVGLLDGTVFENIARMGEADPADVVAAATEAGVHELIGRLPEGYATSLATAHSLSGGQRQRVALARALFGRPRLLVLDEANSSLDHLGEKSLIDAVLRAKREGAAILLITHRPALLAAADRIVTLKDGRVASIADAGAAEAHPAGDGARRLAAV